MVVTGVYSRAQLEVSLIRVNITAAVPFVRYRSIMSVNWSLSMASCMVEVCRGKRTHRRVVPKPCDASPYSGRENRGVWFHTLPLGDGTRTRHLDERLL